MFTFPHTKLPFKMHSPFNLRLKQKTDKMATTQEPENDALHATAKQWCAVFKNTV